MFFEGDLQSGIALAIQQTKRVVCFVRGMHVHYLGEWRRTLMHDFAIQTTAKRVGIGNMNISQTRR